MLDNWVGGNLPRGGGSVIGSPPTLVTATALLVNIFALVAVSVGVPSSISTPVLARNLDYAVSPTAESSIVTGRRVPKQVGLNPVTSEEDHESAGTHHGHGHGFMDHHGGHHHHHPQHHGDGKYFMYAHNPGYDEDEYGYRRGNDHHYQERYEKYGPAWNFKTKVKWADKYGGHGEHYWDYNHAGSGHHDDGGGQGHGHYSEPVPTYEDQPVASQSQQGYHNKVAMIKKRQSEGKKGNVDGRNSKSKTKGSNRVSVRKDQNQIGPGFPAEEGDSRVAETGAIPSLVLDRSTGQIIDTQTGMAYWLKPNAHSY